MCINKYDINEENSQQIEAYCKAQGSEVVAKIPFDKVFTEAMVHGMPVVEYSDGAVSQQIKPLWQDVTETLDKN